MTATLYHGDAATVLATLPPATVRCCVTSPPYWGLRDYGAAGQLGQEATPAAYVAALVAVFRAVRRVLTDDGTLFLNLGDSFNAAGRTGHGTRVGFKQESNRASAAGLDANRATANDLKPKDLIGIPWRVAFALQADGWYLRRDIIWAKPNPMPESVRDRPTSAHEYVFLLSKAERYYYDADAIAEPATYGSPPPDAPLSGDYQELSGRNDGGEHRVGGFRKSVKRGGFAGKTEALPGRNAFRAITETRNARSVWTIATQPYSGAHFATFPEELPRRCLLAGSAPGDTVLDPFGGSGTTAAVAVGAGRHALHIDLNPDYLALAEQRIGPLLCQRGAA